MNNMASAGENRKALDQYFTPAWATLALVRHLEERSLIRTEDAIIEPCAGRGHIIRAIQHCGYNVATAFELDDRLRSDAVATADGYHHWGVDFLGSRANSTHARWAISNPPYTLHEILEAKKADGTHKRKLVARASDFVRKALDRADCVAMLLRLGWLEACQDREDLVQSMSDALIVGRVEFENAGGSGNSSPSVWCIWRKDATRLVPGPQIHYITADERDELQQYAIHRGLTQ